MQKDRVRSDESIANSTRSSPTANSSSRNLTDIVIGHLVASQGPTESANAISDETQPATDASTLSLAVDTVFNSESGSSSWKLCCFAPAIGAIVAGVILQRRQSKSRRHFDFDEYSYTSFFALPQR